MFLYLQTVLFSCSFFFFSFVFLLHSAALRATASYWFMFFTVMMMAFPEKLLAAYNVDGADEPMVKMMMSGMSMQFFGACVTLTIAARSSDKTIR
jgi:hypothetical protein